MHSNDVLKPFCQSSMEWPAPLKTGLNDLFLFN